MPAFAFRMIRDKFKSFIIYSLSALGLLEMYIVLFPAIQKQSANFNEMMKSFPPEMFKAMNMDPSSLSFSTLESYLSTEYMSFLWPILAVIFAISIANYISVTEIDKGTIETLLSLPVKRVKIFIERYLTGLLILISFAVISLLSVILLANVHGIDYVSKNYFTATVGSIFFIWAVYSLSVLFSVIFSEKGKSTMVSSGLLILMYVFGVISALKDSLINLRYFSFFYYFNGPELLGKNIYPDYALLALGGFSIISTSIALLWFSRRDLSV